MMKRVGPMFLALALGGACRATVQAPQVEAVGALAPSYHSIASAPVHAGTDLSAGFQAVDSDETPAVEQPTAEEKPDVTAKVAHGF